MGTMMTLFVTAIIVVAVVLVSLLLARIISKHNNTLPEADLTNVFPLGRSGLYTPRVRPAKDAFPIEYTRSYVGGYTTPEVDDGMSLIVKASTLIGESKQRTHIVPEPDWMPLMVVGKSEPVAYFDRDGRRYDVETDDLITGIVEDEQGMMMMYGEDNR